MMKKNYFDKLNASENRIEWAGFCANVTKKGPVVKKASTGAAVEVSL